VATLLLLILCSAAGSFLLRCLFHFGWDMKRRPRRRSDDELCDESPRSNIVPLQFVGPTSIAFWSQGTWDRFLSIADRAGSLDVRAEGVRKEHFDAAAWISFGQSLKGR
jgi:hypothetical protein